jgi:hypothetical protein
MTNVTHKFLPMYLFLFLTLYMFRARRVLGWSFTKNRYMMHGQQNIKTHGNDI